MADLGKVLIVLGAVVLVVGLLLYLLGDRLPLGRLPGDIQAHRGNVSFYFPLVTFLIISVVLTVIINVIIRLLGK